MLTIKIWYENVLAIYNKLKSLEALTASNKKATEAKDKAKINSEIKSLVQELELME